MSQAENIGAWEKHTKGIGLKLLQKFGFKGRLGANEDGISAAVQVVVRPTNVGLGFGDTVEAPNLPENKKIEAEWKGVDYVEPVTTKSSSWKKSVNGRAKKQRLTFGHDTHLFDIEVDTQPIIDMTFSENNVSKFGVEMLHNISMVAKMQNTAIANESKAIHQSVKRKDELENQLIDLQKRKNVEMTRIAKLNEITTIMVSSRCQNIESLCLILREIYSKYSEEFILFGLIDLIPGYLTTAFRQHRWNVNNNSYFIEIFVSMLSFVSFLDDQGQIELMRATANVLSSVTELKFLPDVTRVMSTDLTLTSSEFLALLKNLQYVLTNECFDQLLESSVVPKIVSLLETPSNSNQLLSLLPWIPLLKSQLKSMTSTIKRYLTKQANNWNPIQENCFFEELVEWRSYLDTQIVDKIIVDSIVPKIVDFYRQSPSVLNPFNRYFIAVSKWLSIIPQLHLDCLLLCGFCPVWLETLYVLLKSATKSTDLSNVQEWYELWKEYFSLNLFHSDCLYVMKCIAVQMMRSTEMSWNEFESQFDVNKFQYIIDSYKSLKYSEILEYKLVEQQILNRISNNANEINDIKSVFIGRSSTIKDVLESLAMKNGIVFVPKHGKGANGRPVWMFGSAQIYFDGQVVFIYKPNSKVGMTSWLPISFDELVQEQLDNTT